MASEPGVPNRARGPRFPRDSRGRLDTQSIDAYAIKAMVDSGEFDCELVFKMILIAQHAGSRPIVDALTTANLSQIDQVRGEICALLDGIRALHRQAAE